MSERQSERVRRMERGKRQDLKTGTRERETGKTKSKKNKDR